jgi:hypothetical protein
MLFFWRIRYLDTRDKQFKDRDLWLNTDELDPATKAAVELCHDVRDSRSRREMLRYRHLFWEKEYSNAELNDLCQRCDRMSAFSIDDYFEDENAKELTRKELAEALTGSPTAIMLPAGTKEYHIEYMLADRRPVALDQVSLSDEHLSVLAYFTRDLRELLASVFYREGPGTLTGADPTLQTAVSDEEIRSFVTIFRRLYLKKEPANFVKAATLLSQTLASYPVGKWIKGAAHDYEAELMDKPVFVPFLDRGTCLFSYKRLIDVFLYTRYAHQPDVKRVRQFQECLAAVRNRRGLLTWLFLTALWKCSLHIRNAGLFIAGFYDGYCEQHGATPHVLGSVSSENPGIGTLEKKQDRIERILNEKADELARAIWAQRGSPSGGPTQFLAEARDQLRATLE